ncbi:MAG: uroporphyrinogen-III C-methyltransferase [Nitrospiraceae bacterium]|nr:uroporphyrinogen-III C-methyltransferase [Nitrospiraceae bacterium]
MKSTKSPKVYLIGAGPGDIGLFTIKGIRCLRKADVVIYDYHLNPQILNYIDHDAEFIYAGKRGGHHAMTQDEINAALIQKAKQGKTVCRLKGGDPFVFGRGGEEAEALWEQGIPFEIVPGVSSSIAAPAYAGIPLTHRKYSSSFSVIAGNEDITKADSTIDWANLASGMDTLVFLMGVKNINAITSKLIEHGKSADTPAAVVRWGTRPEQKTITGTLENIAALVQDTHIKPPAVMIIGNVVKLREHLRWYEDKPLFGQRVLITRKYTDEYSPLEELGAEIFEFPTIELAPPASYNELDAAIKSIDKYNWIVLTSKNAVNHFMRRYFSKGHDIREMKGIKFCAVGSKTAEAMAAYGIKVDMVPDEFNAEGLVGLFIKDADPSSAPLAGIRILLPKPDNARDVFPSAIRNASGEIDTPVIYRSVKPEKHGKRLQRFLKEGRISIATFTSGAAFNNFIEIMGEDSAAVLHDVTIAVIGPVTKKAVEKAGFKVSIMPQESTIKALVQEIISHTTGAAKA